MLFVVLISSFVMSIIELPRLVSKQRWRESIVFCAFVTAGLVLGMILVLRIAAPNPIRIIEAMYKPFTDAFFGKD